MYVKCPLVRFLRLVYAKCPQMRGSPHTPLVCRMSIFFIIINLRSPSTPPTIFFIRRLVRQPEISLENSHDSEILLITHTRTFCVHGLSLDSAQNDVRKVSADAHTRFCTNVVCQESFFFIIVHFRSPSTLQTIFLSEFFYLTSRETTRNFFGKFKFCFFFKLFRTFQFFLSEIVKKFP